MQLSLTGHHIEITPALRAYVETKLGRLDRYVNNVTDAHCVLTVERLRHTAEATIHLGGGSLHADATAENMYAAIDALIDKLDRQAKKFREKLTDHHTRGPSKPRYR